MDSGWVSLGLGCSLKKVFKIFNIVIGVTMFVGGIIGAALSFAKVIGAKEPQLVLQLSWAALWYSGYTLLNVIFGNES